MTESKSPAQLKLDRLLAKRENIFRRIQLCFDAGQELELDRESDTKLRNFKVRYCRLSDSISDYRKTVQDIVVIKQELKPNEAPNYDSINSVEDLCDHIELMASEFIKTDNRSVIRNESVQNKPRINLPKIELVKFDGSDLTLWPIFYENFLQVVHGQPDFSDAEKLQYLLGSVTGKALKTCSSVEATPNNYNIIWKLLEDTYHDKRYLSSLYLDRLLNYRTVVTNKATTLQSFLEIFDTNLSALKRLNVPNLADYIVTHIAMSKLPQDTINAFELVRNSEELPNYDELIQFIRRQNKVPVKLDKPPSSGKNIKTFVTNSPDIHKNCIACRKVVHLLKDCQTFKNMSQDDKSKLIKTNRLCLNCFSCKHLSFQCPSKFHCLKCKGKHHTLLHKDIINPEENKVVEKPTECTQSLCTKIDTVKFNDKRQIVLLSTALVKVKDRWNKQHSLRFLIDSGSMSNLLTLNSCKRLGLNFTKLNANVTGIGGTLQPLRGRTNLTIVSYINPNSKFTIETLLIDQVSNFLPDSQIDVNALHHINNLPLADPSFHTPGEIHGILGASVFVDILGSHRVNGETGTPTAVQTALGYIIMGPATPLNNSLASQSFCSFLNLDSFVENLWELENTIPTTHSNYDEICEHLFSQSVTRDSNGRYTVCLPFKDDPAKLGDSYSVAKKRFLSLEKRLKVSPELYKTYSSIIQDYLDQGHMTLIPESLIDVPQSYYIPHHCVFKSSSTSTPCRIVFDGSAKSDSGVSLNDILFTGPKLQNDVFTVLLNFRLHAIAMTADVKQMYRQVNIIKSHRPFQRILWRFAPNEPIAIYEVNTILFGLRPSPFLSLRTVKQLSLDESQSYPQSLVYVDRDMYMDDLICSVPNVKTALSVHHDIIKLFQAGGFEMLKWMSNSNDLLTKIPASLQHPKLLEFEKNSTKVLGLQWNPVSDNFSFKTDFKIAACTKRTMLSLLARIFDPCGFLVPVLLYLKLLIKNLWLLHIDWDQPAPKEIALLWTKFQTEIEKLNKVEIPRHVLNFENTCLEIIGFADASSVGYAAVIYIRCTNPTGQTNVNFLCAQAKVAPMSQITLPRLELSAALLLAKLIERVRNTYISRKNISNIYAFSDSMITLSWIHSSPHKWKTFISNRVTKIQNCLPPSHWYFVTGKQNVADCGSRGLTPSGLINHPTWFSGPSWLLLPRSQWPIRTFCNDTDEIDSKEESVLIVSNVIISPLYSLIEYFSSWSKLLNATVFVLRFTKILPRNDRIVKPELDKAEITLIRAVQQKHFCKEFNILSENKLLQSNLRRLNPFVDNGIIRVGGRLSNANIHFDHKHPILLPKSDPFVNLLIDYTHKKHCHTGAHLIQAILRQKYWILGSRDVIRKQIWKCNHCYKLHPKPNYPKMSDLPLERVNQCKAFLSTGVDFTGAFHITLGRRRGSKSQKAYVCLFICLATKAVHLELAADLSTDSFLAALKRFLSRRGNCNTLFSDCGTNFIGAKTKLDEIHTFTTSREYKEAFQRELNIQNIDWKFNVPSAPHFGGIWEANIKSVKSHLTKVIGRQILTYEELNTILIQIEALLNSRPLCILSSDPNDPVALTPSHYLNSSPLNSLPAENLEQEPINRLSRYKLLDAMLQHYWKRWRLEYLSTLQIRQKWNSDCNPPKIGTIVIIIQDNIPPLQWPLAIIEELYPGKDGIIRIAKVKTKNSSYLRPVVKLCPLPSQ